MQWEWDLLAFLRRELAPSPARWRATLRTSLAIFISLVFIMALHVPEGEFLLVAIFVLAPPDAGASLEMARLRVAGTLFGGAAGLLLLPLVADAPWLFVVLQAGVIAVAMFLTRTTTSPYACILAAVTFVIVLPLAPTDVGGNVEVVLWRTALTALGVAVASGAQLLFWPDDPEALLLDDLSTRVRGTARLLASTHGAEPGRLPLPADDPIIAGGLTHQLDLLHNAETRSRWVRQRHTEQVALLVTVQRLVTAARRLASLAPAQSLPVWTVPRVARIGTRCDALARALAARQPLEPPAPHVPDATEPPPWRTELDLEVGAAVEEMERALDELPRVTAFLAQGTTTTPTAPLPIREPVAESRLWTPACTLANVEAIRFALKVALAAAICGVVLTATHLPGLATALITCVTVAQSFVGASVRKEVLRLAGAVAGGALALLILVAIIPAQEAFAPYLVVVTAAFGIAAWLTSGSSRIAYVGFQMAIVLALTLADSSGPTTVLTPAGDRIAGILLGVLVMGVVDAALWPVFGEAALRRAVAGALAQMADMHRAAARGDAATRRQLALGLHRALATVVAMQDDLAFDPGRGDRAAVHAALLRVIGGVERLFLDLLALNRHRPATTPAGADAVLARVDAETADAVARLGERARARAGPLLPPPGGSRSDPHIRRAGGVRPPLRRGGRRDRGRVRGSGRPGRPGRVCHSAGWSPTANASAAAELSRSARLSITVCRARASSRSAASTSRMSARPAR